MTLKDIAGMFNRSLAHAFGIKKFFCILIVLLTAGLFTLFFQALATFSGNWFKLPLQFIPLFLTIGFVMAGGIFLIRLYDKELRREKASIWKISKHSWELLLKACFLALLLLLAYFVLWVLIGIFMLLKSIPYLGPILGVLLAFAPFILNLAVLLLFLIALFAFFYGTPPLAMEEQFDRLAIFRRFRANPFLNLLLLGAAFLPVWIVWHFVKTAALMTYHLYSAGDTRIETLLQGVFILLPLVAIMTPAVTFFFNFAYESYLMQTDRK